MNVQAPTRRDRGGIPFDGDPRPVVALPNPGLPGLAIAGIAALVAILLFLLLDGQRKAVSPGSRSSAKMGTDLFAPPPPLVVPRQAAPEAAPVITIPVESLPAPVVQQRMPLASPVITLPGPSIVQPQTPVELVPRLAEPALVYDAGAGGEAGAAAVAASAPSGNSAPADAASQAPVRVQPSVRPTRIANPTTVVPAGTLIQAVLETPIDTSRPGLARAIVSTDTPGFDGKRVLVPRGSRLIGEYDAEVRTGQKKVLVNWTQLIRPDGSVMRLDSPAADAMGGAGVPGRVNSFFFQRFANAMLQTALTVGASLATWSSNAPVVIGLPNSAVTYLGGQGPLAGQAPQAKITVKQGTPFNVFVARDLDFSGAPLGRAANGR